MLFIFVVILFVWLWNRSKSNQSIKWKWSVFVFIALFSHQVRDAFRRGLWFWPFGSTPPIPYPIYLIIEICLPLSMAKIMCKWNNKEREISMGNERNDLEIGDVDVQSGDGDNTTSDIASLIPQRNSNRQEMKKYVDVVVV